MKKQHSAIIRHFCTALFIQLAALPLTAPHAEAGVTADSILIGQTAGFSGATSAQTREMTDGAQAYFEYINRRGGVNGRKVVLHSIDDEYSAARAAENAQKLINNDKVFALTLTRGTPPSEALLPIITEHKIPLIGPVTGAITMHKPFNRYVFNIRATYRLEASNTVRHLAATGVKNIAIVYLDNSFGHDALAGYQDGLKERQLTASATLPFGSSDIGKEVANLLAKLKEIRPQVVLMAGSLDSVASLVKASKRDGLSAQFYTLSNLSTDAFVKALGNAAHGVVVTQVVPYPNSDGIPISKEFQAAIKEAGKGTASYAGLEGYLTAKVLCEGLRRAGNNLTRASFIDAMESMKNFDAGGISLSYSSTLHAGSTFSDITIIGKDGRFIR